MLVAALLPIKAGFEISFRFVMFLPLCTGHATCLSSLLIEKSFSSRSATTGMFGYTKTQTRLQGEIWNIAMKNKDSYSFHGKTLKVIEFMNFSLDLDLSIIWPCWLTSHKLWQLLLLVIYSISLTNSIASSGHFAFLLCFQYLGYLFSQSLFILPHVSLFLLWPFLFSL